MAKPGLKRRFPSPKDLAQLMRFRKVHFRRTDRLLSRAFTIEDLRSIAKKRTPKGPFDYTDGGADKELSMLRARQSFESVQFIPSVLKDVSEVSLSQKILGRETKLPVGISPTGFTRMMHSEGEIAGAMAAEAFGIPFTLSTMGTRSIEEVAQAAPNGRNWFQLYMWKERDRSMALVERAAKAGFEALVMTVDVPVAGDRLRDKYNGLTIPPALSLRTLTNAAPRIGWWWNFLSTDPLRFASLDSWNGTVAELLDSMFDPTVTFDDLKWIRKQWSGKLIVKGVQNSLDALSATRAGADAVILSNHGGRQLDKAPVPFKLVPEVVKKVGRDVEVYMDSGIMHGADIVAAIASGAKFTMVGRAYLYGLMAGGRQGVDATFNILTQQMTRTMKLLGVRELSELTPSHVVDYR